LSTKEQPVARGGRGFQRVVWVVLDGMSHEQARRAVADGGFPALGRIAREGYLGPSAPPSPVCQTPPALLALFSGTEPAQNGVWGYRMPDPRDQERTVSGFSVPLQGITTIWDDLDSRAVPHSLMNVAFRNDPCWAHGDSALEFGLDAYRLWAKPAAFHLAAARGRHTFRGIGFETLRQADRVRIVKGGRTRAILAPGQVSGIAFTRGARAVVQLLGRDLLLVCPLISAMVRGTAPAADAGQGFLEANAFRAARRIREHCGCDDAVSLEAEMALAAIGMRQKADLVVRAAANQRARLVAGYFPLVDEFNHAWIDLFERGQPGSRVFETFRACMALVDGMLSRLMEDVADETLLVVSSDHGTMPHRSILHINERLAEAGLVQRARASRGQAAGGTADRPGYDFRGSPAYYHPSDCGQVLVNGAQAGARRLGRAEMLRRVHAVAAEAGIGVEVPDDPRPYLAFLYPRDAGYFTGAAPRRGKPALDTGKRGGHHLSPLSPTPWMQAVIGLWSSGAAASDFSDAPSRNSALKQYLLGKLGIQ
jgi:predicted AlkP superfamily pyrophosphatase or phosphodiesterase